MPNRSITEMFDVDASTFVHIEGRPGTELTCVEGWLWVTQDGSPLDVDLADGQRHIVTGAAPIVVCGFGPSRLQVVREPSATPWQTILRAVLRRFGAERPTAIEPAAAVVG